LKSLIEFTESGFYCAAGDFYIDPWKPVKNALITHAHSDHLKYGSSNYLLHQNSLEVAKYRLNNNGNFQSIAYRKPLKINEVEVTFYPAGHITGSAQIKISNKKEVWVISGDYKTEDDGLCTPYEPVKCDHFVTESTFGLPVFSWQKQDEVFEQINQWWQNNKAENKCSVLGAYALGKAQRLLQGLDANIGKILTHGAIENVNEVLRNSGIILQKTTQVSDQFTKKDYVGSLVLATPSALNSSWMKRFGTCSTAVASGWMQIRGTRRRRSVDRGFVLSDHCDWKQLNDAIALTEAENIYVTHGYTDIFTKWLNEQGYNAKVVKTKFGDEALEGED